MVNHINGIRHDNRVENLEWVISSENAQKKTQYSKGGEPKKVIQLTLDGVPIKIWDSIHDAARGVGQKSTSGIRCVIAGGKQKTAAGFLWKLVEEDIVVKKEEVVEILEGEVWKSFTEKDSEYLISSCGRIKNPRSGLISYGYTDSNGYKVFTLYKNRCCYIHRLVAEHFIPNSFPEKCVVNHIDNNKENNNVINLEWVTHAENLIHGVKFRTNLRPVDQYTLDGLFVARYPSIAEAIRVTGCKSISSVCSGDKKTSGGFSWRYVKPSLTE